MQDETAPSVSIPPTRPESALDSHPAEEQGQAEQITTAPASEYGHSAAQAQEPTEVIQPASGAATPAVPATGGFNFLQADELTGSSSAPAPAPEQEEKEPKVAREGLEEYEVVPAMQAHEVRHLSALALLSYCSRRAGSGCTSSYRYVSFRHS